MLRLALVTVIFCVHLQHACGWLATPAQAPAKSRTSTVVSQAGHRLRYEQSVKDEDSIWTRRHDTLTKMERASLAALAMVAAVVIPHAARAEGGSVSVYFGQGCFWHVQHEVVKQEVMELGRTSNSITALAGYAGGNKVGDGGRVCYHNLALAPDYGSLGHTEVVSVSVPEEKVTDFAKTYIDAAASYPFGRADPQDRGSEYRSAIGVPGGMDGPYFKQIETANAGRVKLLRGEGNDPDTVGTKKVWVYDSNKFPFHQGEVYHQFHDDMMTRYTKDYHSFKNVMTDDGRLNTVGCPEVGF